MKRKLFIVIAAIIELSVYGIVYFVGYQRGRSDAETLKHNLTVEFEKIAKNTK